MTRFQKIAVATVIATVLLVTVGVIVRATDSGMGCPDWPLCYGQIIPPLDDYKAWWEWIHRTIAAVIGFLILGVAFFAWKDHRDRPSILWPSLAAVALVVFQAWLGRETVRMNNSGDSVTAHLAAAMTLLGLLVYVTVRAFYPAQLPARGGSQRFTLLAVLTAATMFVLLLFGSNVTAQDAGLVFPDWPLMNGSLIPIQAGMDEQVRGLYEAHVLHRYVAGIVLVIVWVTAFAAWRTQRDRRAVFWLACAIGPHLPGPGGDRRPPGLHAPRRLDPDAPRRAQRAALGPVGRARDHQLLRGPPRGAGESWRAGARRCAGGRRCDATRPGASPAPDSAAGCGPPAARPAPPVRHASAPTSP